MKKTIFTVLALLATSLSCNAQYVELLDDDEADDIEALSDITRAISDNVVGKNDEEAKRKSWQRKTFFRISYNKTDFNVQPDGIRSSYFRDGDKLKLDGTNAGNALYDYKSENALSIQWGRNISLHKKAIANMVKFAIDYTWIDLNWNNYKAKYTEDGMVYDTDKTFKESADTYYSQNFLPWGMQKNEVNYGMSIGPSITIAPFGFSNNKHLMAIHLQAYYHFGYSASVLLFSENKKYMTGTREKTAMDIAWGHGYSTSYGFNLSWKAIGVGLEKRSWEKIKYKSIDTDDFGSQEYPFNMKNTRIYLTFNF